MKISKHIVLCGMPGSGKSTVGKHLAARLNCPFIDLDSYIEAEEKKSISEIFQTRGEAAFRELELRYLSLALSQSPSIIALGGGALGSKELLDLVKRKTFPIYLSVGLSQLIIRLQNERQDRPLLNIESWKERLTELEKIRLPNFEKIGVMVNGEQDIEEIARNIIEQVKNHGN